MTESIELNIVPNLLKLSSFLWHFPVSPNAVSSENLDWMIVQNQNYVGFLDDQYLGEVVPLFWVFFYSDIIF